MITHDLACNHGKGFTLSRVDPGVSYILKAREGDGPQARDRKSSREDMNMVEKEEGTHFPGIMDDPGSFSGNSNSPRPHRGPDPRYRISLAIFMNDTAMVLSAPEASTIAS